MEEFVWQLAEQIRRGVTLACDARAAEHGTCRGWDEFSNADLSRFCSDILGQNVEVL
jgi:phosphoribosylformimino-5-aminoimidazole carboxamide ribonucleotide (ProFAR) isomerase